MEDFLEPKNTSWTERFVFKFYFNNKKSSIRINIEDLRRGNGRDKSSSEFVYIENCPITNAKDNKYDKILSNSQYLNQILPVFFTKPPSIL